MKIGIIDDGLDKTHPYFSARGYRMPPGFPKGQKSLTSAKVIVARAFAPRTPKWKYSKRAFDPLNSDHATHVAGIAAGNHRTQSPGGRISGVAPKAYLGNYKVLTVPSGFGLNGNSAEIVAGIEAAVRDGMDVINLSLGEAEIEPSRDIVAAALDGAAAAGVVPVVAAGNNFEELGAGSVTSPGSSDRAITVAAESETGGAVVATFSSGGPTPYSLRMKPDVTAPGSTSSRPFRAARGSGRSSAARAWRRLTSRARRPSCTSVIRPGRLRRSSRRSCRPGSRCCEGAWKPSRRARAAGRSISSAPTRRCSSPRRPVSRSATWRPAARRSAPVMLTDAGGGAGQWTVATTLQQPAGGVSFGVLPAVTAARGARRDGDRGAGLDPGQPHRIRRAHARRLIAGGSPTGSVSPRLRWRAAQTTPLTRTGTYKGDTRGRPALVDSYRYPEDPRAFGVPRCCRARSRCSGSRCGVRSRTSASR